MKIIATYSDGSRSVQYECGDRVRLTKDHYIGEWKTDCAGDVGTIVQAAPIDCRYPITAFLRFQSDRARDGGWGSISVAPWDVETIDTDFE